MANNGNSLVCAISEDFSLATTGSGNLDRADEAAGYDVSGALRVLIQVVPAAGSAAAGIDAVQVSHDGGSQWNDVGSLLAIASADDSTPIAGGVLNSAGADPAAWFKCGPFHGPTLIRVATDTDWTTDAPGVLGYAVGLGMDAITIES